MIRALHAVAIASLLPLPVLSAQQRRDTVRVAVTANATPVEVKLTPVRTIGALDGPPEYAFGELGEIAVDRRGRMFTYDHKDRLLRAYDAAGKFTGTIGRQGAGPGEYRGVAGLAVVADSFLATFDPSLARLTLFDGAGKLARTITETRATTWGDASFFADNAGRAYVRIPIRRPGAGEQMEGEGIVIGARYLGYDTRGRLVDSISVTLPRLSKPQPRGFYIMLPEGGHMAFQPEPTIAPSPDGSIVSGTGETMRFTVTPRTGPVRVVEPAWKPVELTNAEHANWMQWATYMSARDNGRYTYTIPRVKPAYNGIKVDADGRVWVSIFAVAERRDIPPRAPGDKRPLLVWRQRATYDVYDLKGAYLGRVALPHGQSLIQAVGDQLWAMGKGPDDEQLIKVYRMSGMGR